MASLQFLYGKLWPLLSCVCWTMYSPLHMCFVDSDKNTQVDFNGKSKLCSTSFTYCRTKSFSSLVSTEIAYLVKPNQIVWYRAKNTAKELCICIHTFALILWVWIIPACCSVWIDVFHWSFMTGLKGDLEAFIWTEGVRGLNLSKHFAFYSPVYHDYDWERMWFMVVFRH